MNAADPDDRTVASAEYVLGTLTGADRDAFLAQLARDDALQAEVGFWQDRLLGLAARVEPVEPEEAVWSRIEAALQASPQPSLQSSPQRSPQPSLQPSMRSAPEPQGAASRSTTPHATAKPRTTPFWNRVGFWRGFSGVAFAASLLLASMLVLRQPAPPESQYVAVLQGPDKQAGWLVQAAERGPVRLVALADPGSIPAGKSWQFWTKGKDAAAPTSLGLLQPGGVLEIPRSRLPELGDEQLFEITLEPEAGSPTGRPTGPILFIGKARRA